MKQLLILCLITFASNICFAGPVENWFPVGKSGANTQYAKKAACETAEGQECFDVTGKDIRWYKVQSVSEDNLAKPIYKAPYKTAACDTQEACADLIVAKNKSDDPAHDPCDSGDQYVIKDNTLMPGMKIECTKILGYEQVVKNTIVEDAAIKSTTQAQDAVKAALQAKLKQKYKDIAFGKQVKALFSVKADDKNLSASQRIELANDFEVVSRLLDAGSIAAAKSVIAGFSVDGTKVTQADKDEMIALIDAHLAQ